MASNSFQIKRYSAKRLFTLLVLSGLAWTWNCSEGFPENEFLNNLLTMSFLNSPAEPPPSGGSGAAPGIVTDKSAIITTEGGSSVSFNIQLASQPTANVLINLDLSSYASEATLSSPSTLTFSPTNWNVNQSVTVAPVDDATPEAAASYSLNMDFSASLDPSYKLLTPIAMPGVNLDNDTLSGTPGAPAILVLPAALTITEGGTADFSVVLQSQPSDNVSLGLVNPDPAQISLSASTVSFTPTNWNVPVPITVTAIDDALGEASPALYTITWTPDATTTDSYYNGLSPVSNVAVNVNDNDTPGVKLSKLTLSTAENGAPDVFTVELTSKPTAGASVTICLYSDNTAEADIVIGGTSKALVPGPDCSAPYTARLVFTDADYNIPQNVEIQGADDAIADGSKTYNIITGLTISPLDGNYSGLTVDDLSGTNADDETPSIIVTAVGAPFALNEGTIQSKTVNVKLSTAPQADVVIDAVSSNTQEASVSPATITLNATNWSTGVNVTVTNKDDLRADGTQGFDVRFFPATSTDSAYNGLNPADVTGNTNADNDTAGVILAPPLLFFTHEGGAINSVFYVYLTSEPTANGTSGTIASGNTGEGVVSASSLTFTPANWFTPQALTVSGVEDTNLYTDIDGNKPYTVDFGSVSGAAEYVGATLPGNPFTLTNLDNEKSTFITATPTGGDFVTTAAGMTPAYGGSVPKEAADWICNNDSSPQRNTAYTYKALIGVDDGTIAGSRIAMSTPGQTNFPNKTDWVFIPKTAYWAYDSGATTWKKVMTTDAQGLYDFSTSLLSAFDPSASTYIWTGIYFDWTLNTTNNCLDWTSAAGGNGGAYGSPNLLTSGSIFFTSAPCTGASSAKPLHLLCVQQ